jgi:tripartite-type tricarboxylate transporter receptor subunit TctC
VPGYEASTWTGIGAPRGTPAEIVEKLNDAVNAGLADAKLKGQLFDLGATVLPGSPVDFAKFLVEETKKWGKWSNSPAPRWNEPRSWEGTP